MFEFETRPFAETGDLSGGATRATGESGNEPAPAEIIDALASTIVRFARLIENRSNDDLHRPAQDGRWGVTDILSHLDDWEIIFHERVARILGEETPELETYDDSLWAIEHDYSSRDGHAVFERFAGQRQALVEHLRDLGEEAWGRGAILAGEGEITLRGLLQWLAEHDKRHFGQAQEVFG